MSLCAHCHIKVIKELSAKVVGPVRKHLAQVSPEIFSILFRLYQTSHPIGAIVFRRSLPLSLHPSIACLSPELSRCLVTFSIVSADHNVEAAFIELYITKISRRLLCYGFPRLDLSEEITRYLECSLQSLQARTFMTFQDDNEAHQLVSKTSVKTAILVNMLSYDNLLVLNANCLPALLRFLPLVHYLLRPLPTSSFPPSSLCSPPPSFFLRPPPFSSLFLDDLTLEHFAQAVITNPSHNFQPHQ
eukprot:755341-Hanusia_phi.AAC.2